MIKLQIEIEESKKNEVYVSLRRIDKDQETNAEGTTFDDIFDLIQYYVVGDEVEDTTNEIIKNMKAQHDKNSQ